jgi:hypothetical protein
LQKKEEDKNTWEQKSAEVQRKKLVAPTVRGHHDVSKTLFRIHVFTNARTVEE